MASTDHPGRRGRHLAAFTGVLASGVLLVALSLGFLVTDGLRKNRAQRLEMATLATQNIALVLSQNLDNELSRIDTLLQMVGDEYAHQKRMGRMDNTAMEAFIRRQIELNPFLVSLRITDPDGHVTHGHGGMQVSLADRDYFLAQKTSPSLGLHISAPIVSRFTGQWALVLSRRLPGDGDAFRGIVSTILPIERLARSFAEVQVGPRGSVSLRDDAFRVIARYPDPSSGPAVGQAQVSETLKRLLRAGKSHGTYLAMAPVDGIRRLYAFRRVGSKPLLLIVGLAEEDILAPWRSETRKTLAMAFLTGLLTLASAAILFQSWLKGQRDAKQLELRGALLAQANAQLQEADFQKNTFLGIAVHDLRNPLNGIVLSAEVLEDEDDPAEVKRLARLIQRTGMEMSSLLGRFLDITRIESGNIHVEPKPFDAVAILHQVAKRHKAASEGKGIGFAFFHPDRTEALADPHFVQEALDNLVSNAVKFSPNGSTVTLRVETPPEEIVVSVEDQGPGFTEADRQALFQRFAKLSAAPTGGESSTGLGLSIVKHLLEATGATITLESAPGQGATFRIHLPRA